MTNRTDLSRWAVVAPKDDTGLGRMAVDAVRVLGLRRHIVIPSERLPDRPQDPATDVLLRPTDPESRLVEVLAGLQGVIFFERPGWHPSLLATARRLGIKSVCVPMWEWFHGGAPDWNDCDLFACPSEFAADVVRRYGWRNVVVLPWAYDVGRFPARAVVGPARLFVHNAGLVDRDDRKGTRDTIEAFKRVRRADVRLVVRMQKEVPLPQIDSRIEVRIGNLADPTELYADGECAIQPSKMEGIGFMVLEPLACGLPVITLDYPPMNGFAVPPELRVRKRWFKRKAFANLWIPQAHLRLPHRGDLVRKIEWCAENDLSAVSRRNRAWALQEFDSDRLRRAWTEALSRIENGSTGP